MMRTPRRAKEVPCKFGVALRILPYCNGSNQMFTCPVRFFGGFSRATVIFLISILLFALALRAQGHAPAESYSGQAPVPPATSATPALSTEVDEVSFDLSVRSKHNKPVLDLQPSQLRVTDDGSPVRLSSLRMVDGASRSQRLVSLVFDRLSMSQVKAVRKLAESILGTIPEPGYSIAVFQVTGRLRLLQPFTQDRHLIDTAVMQAAPDSLTPPSADFTRAEKALMASLHSDTLTLGSEDRAEGKLIFSALEQSQHILDERRSYPSLAALQALVLSDEKVTGRKFIFYFSSGINTSSDAQDILRSIASMANRAGVTIWVIDSSRVNTQMSSEMQGSMASTILGKGSVPGNVSAFGNGQLGSSVGNGASGFSSGGGFNNVAARDIAGYAFGDVGSDQSPFVALAFGTGGVYIGATGSYKHQLQRLHEDLTNWYEVSWTPPIKSYDGRFRPVVVRSLRKEVKVRTRSGYFAVPPSEVSGIRPFEIPLLNILAGPKLPIDIAYQAGVLHLGELADGNGGELVVRVPVSQLSIHEDPNSHVSSVHAAIVAVIKDSKGTVLERLGEDFPLHEAPEAMRNDPSHAITLEEHFSGDPGVYTLETAVMDRIANKAGAQHTTFTIERPPQGPAVSDIAMVDRVEPVEGDDQSFDPMLYRDGRVLSNLSAELPGDTHSLSFFFLLHPVGGESQPVLRMQVLREGNLITEMPMELEKVSGTGAAIPYLVTIRGRAFPPGRYEVKALFSQDSSTASSSTSFRVEGTAAGNSPNPTLSAAGEDGSDSRAVSDAATANSQFVITNPASPLVPPSAAEIQATIEEVRQRALTWSDSLVNFMCIEVTNHSVDASGHGGWQHKDTLVETMTYINHEETRSTVMLNGERSSVQPDHFQFTHSAGEFGAVFHVVFDPLANANFTWKKYAVLDGQTVQVFAFQVALANSSFDLVDRAGDTARVGFHGLLYLAPTTRTVRRISIDADDIPAKLNIRASSVSVDYSWISMQDHDFLLPVRGAVSLQESKKRPVLNEFEFFDYHRFGSHSHILSDDELNGISKD